MTAKPESRNLNWMPVADPVISGDQVRHVSKAAIFRGLFKNMKKDLYGGNDL
jgi:hypothetical protein